MVIKVGMVFDTPFETNCVVTAAKDSEGKFLAKATDGIESEYVIEMVTRLENVAVSLK